MRYDFVLYPESDGVTPALFGVVTLQQMMLLCTTRILFFSFGAINMTQR